MKINENYIKELAEGFQKPYEYVHRIVSRHPNPRNHFAILDGFKIEKRKRDYTHLKALQWGKYKGMTIEEMIVIAKKCESLAQFKEEYEELANFLYRVDRLSEVKKYLELKEKRAMYHKAFNLAIRYDSWGKFIKNNDALYRRLMRRNLKNRVKKNYLKYKDYVHQNSVYTYNDYLQKVIKHGGWGGFRTQEKQMYQYLSNHKILKAVKAEVMSRYKEYLREINKKDND